MVLPLEGVSRVAVILRFYRWREHLLLRVRSSASLAWAWPLASGAAGVSAAAACRELAGGCGGLAWDCGWLAGLGQAAATPAPAAPAVLVASPTNRAWGRALVQVSVQEIV